MTHTSVLLKETIDGLNIQSGDTFVDCTLGDGGHSVEVAKQFGAEVTIVGIDRDENSLAQAKRNLEQVSTNPKQLFLALGNFRNVDQVLHSFGFSEADKFLFDIGLSSRQIEESGRGFS
ncbi:MAG TPA: 16S rRNA (cytosine(1402)-N(4))-methyltransferase, partial [Candidatus Nanoarchaeia archaeon]|nr:16S rRNA (cytosine(1402)-N(4))-methyltransferase [Candidatus Nanoarchaeia archaeon]